MKIVWSDTARADLRYIHAYIARDSQFYAKRTLDGLKQAVARLSKSPESGARVVEWSDPDYREVHSGNYRVVYRLKGRVIEVVTVIHAARQFPTNPPV